MKAEKESEMLERVADIKCTWPLDVNKGLCTKRISDAKLVPVLVVGGSGLASRAAIANQKLFQSTAEADNYNIMQILVFGNVKGT